MRVELGYLARSKVRPLKTAIVEKPNFKVAKLAHQFFTHSQVK